MRYFIREIKSYRYVVVPIFTLLLIIRTLLRENNCLLQQVNFVEDHLKQNDKILTRLRNQIEFADSFTKINGHIGKVFQAKNIKIEHVSFSKVQHEFISSE